jgi:death-on-curing protein
MRYLTVDEVLITHARVVEISGGSPGIRDRGGLESAVAQPGMTFGGVDLYPGVARKAAALGHSLISNHPFVDGNKRVGHAAMEVMLMLNGYEISAVVDEQEEVVLAVAAGTMSRDDFADWVARHVVESPDRAT